MWFFGKGNSIAGAASDKIVNAISALGANSYISLVRFGRIGRLVLRTSLSHPDLRVVSINDPFIDLDYMVCVSLICTKGLIAWTCRLLSSHFNQCVHPSIGVPLQI